VAVRTYRQHRPDQREIENLDIHFRLGQDIGNRGDLFAQQSHRCPMVGCPGQLALQIDAAERVMREVLDRVAEHLVVADDRLHIVRRVDHGRKQAELGDGSGHASNRHEVANLHRPQHHEERTRREVGEQA